MAKKKQKEIYSKHFIVLDIHDNVVGVALNHEELNEKLPMMQGAWVVVEMESVLFMGDMKHNEIARYWASQLLDALNATTAQSA